MTKLNYKQGFSAIELLITLFIAAAFLVTGYQLYNITLKDGGKVRSSTTAYNLANNYVEMNKYVATNPCTVLTPLNNSSVVVPNMSEVKVTVNITCPYGTASSISKILVTVSYGKGLNSNEIQTASYVAK